MMELESFLSALIRVHGCTAARLRIQEHSDAGLRLYVEPVASHDPVASLHWSGTMRLGKIIPDTTPQRYSSGANWEDD